MLMRGSGRALVFALTVALTFSCWFGGARAEELQTAETVKSLMERLIPRNQLLSYGPGDFPTFYRWYAPIRLTVVSREDRARAFVEREIIGPLLDDFRAATRFDAALVAREQEANVLLIIGEWPR